MAAEKAVIVQTLAPIEIRMRLGMLAQRRFVDLAITRRVAARLYIRAVQPQIQSVRRSLKIASCFVLAQAFLSTRNYLAEK